MYIGIEHCFPVIHIGFFKKISTSRQASVIDENIYGILGTKKVIQNYQSEGAGGVKQLAAQLKRWKNTLKP